MGDNGHIKSAGPGRSMSRGEFLGTGAMAAAGMAAGGAGLESAGSTQELQCAGPHCNPSGPITWAIPAGILNALWCDFFPRLVALSWLKTWPGTGDLFDDAEMGAGPPPPDFGSTFEALDHGMGADKVVAALQYLEQRRVATKSPCKTVSSVWTRRLNAVLTFFQRHRTKTGKSFPLFIAGRGGYDFLLTDPGIYLFMPDLRVEAGSDLTRELIRYYFLRQPGRPTLGIPFYLDPGVCSLLAVDAPTGPSQIELDPAILIYVLGLDPDGAAAQGLACHLGLTDEEWGMVVEAARAWIEGRGYPSRITKKLGFEDFVCGMRKERCWVLEGAVYRGIAGELPRIVAGAWIENLTGQTGDTRSYWYRFNRPEDNGLRSIFMERMETMLPLHEKMHFQTEAPSTASEWEDAGVWIPGDVMITNNGLYFPPLSEPIPRVREMAIEIAEGRAGNPVFTDSRRPDGNE